MYPPQTASDDGLIPSTSIPTGWQCPVCRKVHAPRVDSCDCHAQDGYTYPEFKEKFFPNVDIDATTGNDEYSITTILTGTQPEWFFGIKPLW